jgi:hypothetical protein
VYWFDLQNLVEGGLSAAIRIPGVKISKLLNLLSVEFMERVGQMRVMIKELQKFKDSSCFVRG